MWIYTFYFYDFKSEAFESCLTDKASPWRETNDISTVFIFWKPTAATFQVSLGYFVESLYLQLLIGRAQL